MRWLFLTLTFACGGMAFITDSQGLMGLSLLLLMLFGFLAVLAFAQARIEAGAQSQASMIGSRDVQVLRQQSLQKKVMQSKTQPHGNINAGGGGATYSSYAGSRPAQESGDGNSDGGGSDGGGGSD
jgi:uncharacterized membrane protein YgcG